MEIPSQSTGQSPNAIAQPAIAGQSSGGQRWLSADRWGTLLLIVLALLAAGIALWATITFATLDHEAPLLLDSTLGELALWMADQSEEESPESLLGQFAQSWASSRGQASLSASVLLSAMQIGVLIWGLSIGALIVAGVSGLGIGARWSRYVLFAALIGLNTLLLIVPTRDADPTLPLLLVGIVALLIVLPFAPGRVTRVIGFVVVLSSILVIWETAKIIADSLNYRVTIAQPGWAYTTYPTLDASLAALTAGEVDALFIDQRDVRDVMLPHPPDPDDPLEENRYPELRWLDDIAREQTILSLPITPDMPGRLTVAVRADDVARWPSIADLPDANVAAVAGEFADERFLAAPRELLVLDLKIFNDLNLPHLQVITEAFLQPARRNGPLLLARILGDAALFTWSEALLGFLLGSGLGLLLGTLFAHSALLERSLLPYVVASQTVPILAIAPMVVIWLGGSPLSVAVIAAYITFFPVTINTLRGLLSPQPTAVELVRSYAANRWQILWMLRFPAALPYIFTALKVSATASVVGAIIGELPSGISEGLGRAILNFSSDYSAISTPKLWAAIISAAAVGIVFFVIVSLIEHYALRRHLRRA
ncbi:MAG: ABC transporter permease subunit [Chloroflexi bacterium]|nr:ABC transporter permease subunit [Chloroflexota bacterium]